MWDYMLLLFPIAVVGVSFFGCKKAEKGSFEEEAWSRDQGKRIQAIACLCIILHHLTQIISNYGWNYRGPITIFNETGFLFTSIFFFFSGYGLITSVHQKEGYLDHFLRNRLSTVLIPFWVCNIIYILVRLFYNKIQTPVKVIVGHFFGYPIINDNGWFMIEITVLYLAFFLLFRLIKNKDVAMVLLSLFVVGIIAFSIPRGHDDSPLGNHWFMGEWWYNSTILFVMGMLVARFKEQVQKFVKKHYKGLLATSIVSFVLVFVLVEYLVWTIGFYNPVPVIKGIRNELLVSVPQMLLCIIFVWFILLMNLKISLHSPVLIWIGTISLELYLIHGVFVKHIFDFTNWNVMLMYGVVFICGIVSAKLLWYVDKALIKRIIRR